MISPGHEATVGDHSGTFVPQKWVQPGPVFCTLMPEKDSRILILGGGFGGLFTALDLTGAGEVTLVSDEDHFLFKPMLYEYLSGEVEAWHIAPEFKELPMVQKMKKYLNFVGVGLEPTGQFLHQIRRATTELEFFRSL